MTETGTGPVVSTLRHGPSSWDMPVMEMPTSLLTLTPAFMTAMKTLAPKKRRSKIPAVIALAILAVVAVLGVDAPTREFGLARGRQVVARLQHATAAKHADALPAPAVITAAPGVVELAPSAPVVTPSMSSPVAPAAPVVVKAEEPALAPVLAPGAAAKKPSKATPASKKSRARPASRRGAARKTVMLAAQVPGSKARSR